MWGKNWLPRSLLPSSSSPPLSGGTLLVPLTSATTFSTWSCPRGLTLPAKRQGKPFLSTCTVFSPRRSLRNKISPLHYITMTGRSDKGKGFLEVQRSDWFYTKTGGMRRSSSTKSLQNLSLGHYWFKLLIRSLCCQGNTLTVILCSVLLCSARNTLLSIT